MVYLLTVNHPRSASVKSTVACIPDDKIEELYNASKYDIRMEAICLPPHRALKYEEALKWVKNVELHKREYVRTGVMYIPVILPEGVSYADGVIKVETSPFKEHTVDTCHKEIELMNWVINTFKHAKYHKCRNTFYIGETWSEEVGNFKHTYIIQSYDEDTNCLRIESESYERKLVVL